MFSYSIKRLLFVPAALLIVSFLTFTLINLSPSDPAEVILRVSNIQLNPLAIESVRQEFGLHQPFLTRYFNWLSHALHFDFGLSYITKEQVSSMLMQAFWPSLYLLICVVILTIAISLPIGIFLAINENRFIDKVGRLIIFTLIGMPDYWIALLLIWLISVKLDWLPINGMSGFSSAVLPSVTLAFGYIGIYVKLIRNNILQQLPKYYVLYARAKGLKESVVIGKYVMINAIQSTLVVFGMSIPRLIAGMVVIENIFAWPGMGRLCVNAISEHDYPVIQAYILLISLLYLLFNQLTDLLQVYINPQLREHKAISHD